MTSTAQRPGPGGPGRPSWLPADWAPAFAAVPRSAFLPDEMWPWDMDARASVHTDRRRDPDAWQRWAHANVPIVTQWDDGQHAGTDPGHVPTSSSSMPHVVAGMLHDLDLQPGMRVLELGTGTGWSAALMAHRIGEHNVVSVEVDKTVADKARQHLDRAGLHPTLVVGDGLAGHPDGGPYDRIVATMGLRHIPPALLAQLRPGGVLLAPWGTDYANEDALLRLTAHSDGGASGPFLRELEFMKARAQRATWPNNEDYAPDWDTVDSPGTTALRVGDLDAPLFSPARWSIGLAVPHVVHTIGQYRPGVHSGWWYSLTDRSWAAVSWQDGATTKVWQDGGRRLFDEVETAWHWWNDHGRPEHNRYGLTITPDGRQQPWLDHPGQLVH